MRYLILLACIVTSLSAYATKKNDAPKATPVSASSSSSSGASATSNSLSAADSQALANAQQSITATNNFKIPAVAFVGGMGNVGDPGTPTADCWVPNPKKPGRSWPMWGTSARYIKDPECIEIEKRKLELEERRVALEEQKLALERDRLAIQRIRAETDFGSSLRKGGGEVVAGVE